MDGQENPPGTIVDTKHYEVQKYMTESRHGFLHYVMVFNKPWFDAQSQANQQILLQAMQEAGRWQRQAMMNRDADATQRIKEAGVQVHELTTQAREQFRQPALKVHERFADRVDKDYLQRVYAAIMQASK